MQVSSADEPEWAAHLSWSDLFQMCVRKNITVTTSASRAEMIDACVDTRDVPFRFVSPSSRQVRVRVPSSKIAQLNSPRYEQKKSTTRMPVQNHAFFHEQKTQSPSVRTSSKDGSAHSHNTKDMSSWARYSHNFFTNTLTKRDSTRTQSKPLPLNAISRPRNHSVQNVESRVGSRGDATPRETKQRSVLEKFGLVPGKKLGFGTDGTVYKVERKGQVCAAKMIEASLEDKKDGIGAPDVAVREATLYRRIPSHQSITQMYQVLYDPEIYDGVILLLEYSPFGDLHSALNAFWLKSKQYDEARRMSRAIPLSIKIAYDLVCGLSHAHACNVIVVDLKPRNVLVFENRQTKLSDLGGAYRLESDIPYFGDRAMSTVWWRSPEENCGVSGQSHIGFARDMWSLGIILLQVFFNKVPTDVSDARELFGKWSIMLGRPNSDWIHEYNKDSRMCKDSDRYPHDRSINESLNLKYFSDVYYKNDKVPNLFYVIVDLIEQLLNWSPEKRLSTDAALQHQLFTKVAPLLNVQGCQCEVFHVDQELALPDVAVELSQERNLGKRLKIAYETTTNFSLKTLLNAAAIILVRFRERQELETTSLDLTASILIAVKALFYPSYRMLKMLSKKERDGLPAAEARVLTTLNWDIDGPLSVSDFDTR